MFLKLGVCLMLVSLSLVKKRGIPMCNTAIVLPIHELCCSFLLFLNENTQLVYTGLYPLYTKLKLNCFTVG